MAIPPLILRHHFRFHPYSAQSLIRPPSHGISLSLEEAVELMNNPIATQGGPIQGSPASLLSSWSAFTRSWIAAEKQLNVIFVKYEEMKADPLPTFSRRFGPYRHASRSGSGENGDWRHRFRRP